MIATPREKIQFNTAMHGIIEQLIRGHCVAGVYLTNVKPPDLTAGAETTLPLTVRTTEPLLTGLLPSQMAASISPWVFMPI